MLDDVNVVVDMALAENPAKSVFLVGHSMGGFAVSLYGVKYPNKRLAGVVTSGAVTHDNRRLISDMPRTLDPHMQLPNELGSGVCSVPEVVAWYGKDPYNRKSFSVGLCDALIAGWAWFHEKEKEFAYPVLMLHGEDDAVSMKDTYDFFAAAAFTDRQMIDGWLYDEIFNEYCRATRSSVTPSAGYSHGREVRVSFHIASGQDQGFPPLANRPATRYNFERNDDSRQLRQRSLRRGLLQHLIPVPSRRVE